jgi:hypothetical protein
MVYLNYHSSLGGGSGGISAAPLPRVQYPVIGGRHFQAGLKNRHLAYDGLEKIFNTPCPLVGSVGCHEPISSHARRFVVIRRLQGLMARQKTEDLQAIAEPTSNPIRLATGPGSNRQALCRILFDDSWNVTFWTFTFCVTL